MDLGRLEPRRDTRPPPVPSGSKGVRQYAVLRGDVTKGKRTKENYRHILFI